MTHAVGLEDAYVNILITLNGQVHLVAINHDNYDAISFLVKRSAKSIIKTDKTQSELNRFLNCEGVSK